MCVNIKLIKGNPATNKGYMEGRKMEEIERMWDWLVDMGIATHEEIKLITQINGYNIETLNDVLFARTGYRDREQMEGE